jgi:lipopolysaccharide/colanic/teichoic acid biosynthesis glycosyltransferase
MLSQHIRLIPWQMRWRYEHSSMIQAAIYEAVYLALKRWLDVFVSLALLIFLAPLMLATAIAVKLDSPGPVIYAQRRGGLNGRLFNFYKFRSMSNGRDHTQEHRKFAEAYITGRATDHQQGESRQAIYKPATNGHAVTRVGRWLRSSSLDELPQLFNVLKGDMSLVGPRPSIDYEVVMYTEWHRQRLAVLPGLTGWAQINGRSRLAFDEIVGLDLEYIAHRSLRWDLSILLATVPVVLRAHDAG